MAPPVFSLQSVLNVRHSRVEALEVALGQLLAEEMKARTRLQQIQSERRQLIEQISEALQGDLDLVRLELLRNQLHSLDNMAIKVQIILNEFARQVALRRAELVNARLDEEVLETLKKQRQEVYNAEQSRKEAVQQDDLYIARSFRQQIGLSRNG